MDIRRLTHFIALAEEGRFAAAAQRVHLSQAAFSRSIQTLEQRLGMRLVDRGADGVSLTAAGAAVLARARTLVFDSECLARDVAMIKDGQAGELAIGVAPIPAATVLEGLMVRLQRERPRLKVQLHFGNLAVLLQQLQAQQLDFCLGDPRLLPSDERLVMTEVLRPRAALVCRADHPALAQPAIDAALLRQYGLGTIAITRELLLPLARDLGFASLSNFPVRVQCDDVGLLLRMARQTELLIITPEMPAGSLDGLRQLPWPGARAQFAHVHAIWLRGRTLSSAAQFAIDVARQAKPGPASPVGRRSAR